MKYTKFEYDTFNIYTIKTDKFKNCHVEIIYRDNVDNDMSAKSFATEMISYSSKQFPTRKDMVIRLEELYNTYFYSVSSKVGNTFLSNFILDFLDPVYVNEPEYLNDVFTFLFDSIQNPNIKDNSFDYRSFQILKNSLKAEIDSLKENPTNYSLRRTLDELYKDSVTSKRVIGTIEELEDITPESLYESYKNIIKNSYCDIYIIGNLDMEEVKKIILKHFKNNVIKKHQVEIMVHNKKYRKTNTLVETSHFVQTNLIMAMQLNTLTEFESNYVLSVFAEIFCGTNLNSKLYDYLRTQNSLCYNVKTIYQKYDGVMFVHVGLDEENTNLAINLTKKGLKEMQSGKFSEEDIKNSIKYLKFASQMSLDNQNSIINNYVFHEIAGIPFIKDRIKNLEKVTKQDVINLAKKLSHIYTYKLMGEVKNETN